MMEVANNRRQGALTRLYCIAFARGNVNMGMSQHETYITRPDDSSKVVREAIPPAGQQKVVVPGPTDQQAGILPDGQTRAQRRDRWCGMARAWRGLRLLGVALGIAAVWFVAAWIHHGTVPLGLYKSGIRSSFGSPSPILPPMWLVAILGLLGLIAILMMLLGTQDANPRMKFRQKQKPTTPDGSRQPADGSSKPPA